MPDPENPELPEIPQPQVKPEFANDVKTRLRRAPDGELHHATTVHVDLPEPLAEILKRHDLAVKFKSRELSRILLDQSAGMVSTDGCISSPGGPGC
ncbi:MAG: hypothetical protein JSS99_04840 [Actinobacteria bacterium]|nr:hypothetical protein [Actinomycetota bacterium]